MEKNWLKEGARDFIALGSIPFLILVIARVIMLKNPSYLMQFIFAAIIFFVLMLIFKANLYAGLGLIMLTFTILYYNEKLFTILASIAYIGIVCSLFYLKKDKIRIIKGVIFGVISTGLSYYIVRLMFV